MGGGAEGNTVSWSATMLVSVFNIHICILHINNSSQQKPKLLTAASPTLRAHVGRLNVNVEFNRQVTEGPDLGVVPLMQGVGEVMWAGPVWPEQVLSLPTQAIF